MIFVLKNSVAWKQSSLEPWASSSTVTNLSLLMF